MLESGQAPYSRGSTMLTSDEVTLRTMAKMEERGDFKRTSAREKNFLKDVWTNKHPSVAKAPKTAGAPNII